MSKKVIVLGASPNASRYSHRAVRKLIEYGYDVYPVGVKKGKIENLDILEAIPALNEKPYCVVLYINAEKQAAYYTQIIGLLPECVYFNPGTYNNEFEALLKSNHISVVEGCTLAALSMGEF